MFSRFSILPLGAGARIVSLIVTLPGDLLMFYRRFDKKNNIGMKHL